ncbi:hypothetical protein VNO77_03514 [Canavalia gladiata]|uniref:Uncharacterized protein n=1 Tax=Canavalia gladiata TaxID=3824 RepID=A0AAN9N0H9_CANGL
MHGRISRDPTYVEKREEGHKNNEHRNKEKGLEYKKVMTPLIKIGSESSMDLCGATGVEIEVYGEREIECLRIDIVLGLAHVLILTRQKRSSDVVEEMATSYSRDLTIKSFPAHGRGFEPLILQTLDILTLDLKLDYQKPLRNLVNPYSTPGRI